MNSASGLGLDPLSKDAGWATWKTFAWGLGVYSAAALLALLMRTLAGDSLVQNAWIDTLTLQGSQLAIALWLFRRHRLTAAESGLVKPTRRFAWLLSVAIAVLCAVVTGMLAIGLDLRGRPEVGELSLASRLFWWGAFAPVAEEIYARGWFQSSLARTIRQPMIVIGYSTLFFAFLHLFEIARGMPVETATFRFIYALVLGYLAAQARWRYQSLLPAIAIHVTWNMTAMLWLPTLRLIADGK